MGAVSLGSLEVCDVTKPEDVESEVAEASEVGSGPPSEEESEEEGDDCEEDWDVSCEMIFRGFRTRISPCSLGNSVKKINQGG